MGPPVHLLARARRHHRYLRQLLIVIGAGAQRHRGTARRIPVLCRSDPDGGVTHGRVDWETTGQYMDRLDKRLCINVGNLIRHTAVRHYVMGDEWKVHMARVEETAALGIRAYPMCSPNRVTQDFTMKNCQVFRGLPTWHPILLMSDEEKLRLYADPEIRAKLHEEAVVNKPDTAVGFSKTWSNYMWVNQSVLEKNKWMQFKTIGQIAEKQGKRVIDAFLDLAVEEKLETRFLQAENNVDDEALTKILTHPNAVIGLGDGGAHVQFHGGYGYLTKLLGEWVREKQGMSLEQAVRRLTFDSATVFSLYDRGLLRPGMAADVVIFDPATLKCGHEGVVRDFPKGAWRLKEPADASFATVVNGQALYDEGKHTGALPGRVLRNTYYHANHA